MKKTIRKYHRRTQRKKGGGSENEVPLNYDGKLIFCEICNHKYYEEIYGTLGKSKTRSTVGQFIFGDIAGTIDNTSLVLYVCKKCGYCRIIRDKKGTLITTADVVTNPMHNSEK